MYRICCLIFWTLVPLHFTYLRVRGVFRTQSNFWDAAFLQKHFCKEPPPQIIEWVAITVLHLIGFVFLFPSTLNWVILRYVNNIGISSFLETFQTRKFRAKVNIYSVVQSTFHQMTGSLKQTVADKRGTNDR